VIVAASTDCFPDLSLAGALGKLVDLEFTNVDIAIHEDGRQIKPSQVLADVDAAVQTCRQTYRMTPAAFSVDIRAEGEEYYQQFAACCRLAKAIKVVTITVPCGELGTPFNAEVERLRELVAISSIDGIRVSIKTEVGRMSENPDTAVVLCNSVKGLGITLDPSHFIFGPHRGGSYDQVFKHVHHVHLRDTSKTQLQVRVGQGEVEYGKLVNQLIKAGYDRCLSIHIAPAEGVDQDGEMRKLRLLLESLL
jgi:sugar phosphate isomerase/epimerase